MMPDRRTVLLFVVAGIAACGQKPEGAEAVKPAAAPAPTVKVETGAVEIHKMPRYLTLTGSIVADRQSEVAANVSGRVTTAPIERGQAVKQGQLLAVVDARAAGFSAAAAAAQSKAAATQEQLAQADCGRADALYQRGAISKAEYDRMRTQCSAQMFTATAARENASLAQKQLGDTTIRAPFDGVIGERYVNVGEFVQSQTRVVSLYRVNPARVQISVPEPATPLVHEGATLQVQVAAYGDRSFPATVKYVSPALRAQTRDLLIEALAPNGDGALRPGMFATVQIQIGETDEPTVALDALKVEGTTKRIYLARNGLALEMVVRTGATKDGRVAVLEPLTESDRVILKPPPGLRDGVAIQ